VKAATEKMKMSIGSKVEFSVFVMGNGQIWNGRGRVPQGSTLVFHATVERETEKAIMLRCDTSRKCGWSPKSAVKDGQLADWIAAKLARECGFSADAAYDCL
jgi:hypothetical protein